MVGGGKFGGDIPPNCGGNLTCPPQAILKISPPNDVFWGGQRGLWVWRGNRSKFSLSPPKKCRLEGTFVDISPANLEGTANFGGVPPNVGGDRKSCPPPLLRWWGGTLCPPQTWGDTWGDGFCVGGEISLLRPPQLGGKCPTMG